MSTHTEACTAVATVCVRCVTRHRFGGRPWSLVASQAEPTPLYLYLPRRTRESLTGASTGLPTNGVRALMGLCLGVFSVSVNKPINRTHSFHLILPSLGVCRPFEMRLWITCTLPVDPLR